MHYGVIAWLALFRHGTPNPQYQRNNMVLDQTEWERLARYLLLSTVIAFPRLIQAKTLREARMEIAGACTLPCIYFAVTSAWDC